MRAWKTKTGKLLIRIVRAELGHHAPVLMHHPPMLTGLPHIGFEKHGLLLSHYGWPLKSNAYPLPGSWINHVPGKGLGLGFSLSGPTSGEGSGVRTMRR